MQNYNNCVLIAIIIKLSYSIVYFHSHDLTQRSVSCTKNMSVYGSFEKKNSYARPAQVFASGHCTVIHCDAGGGRWLTDEKQRKTDIRLTNQ